MSVKPGIAEALRRVLHSHDLDFHTALPCKVVRYDAEQQEVDAQPMIKQVVISHEEDSELEESFPLLRSIPVAFPRGGNYFLSFPLKPGDFVFVIFSERSVDRFRELGREVHPVDLEMHGLSGAVAIPGFYPDTANLAEADAEKLVLGKDGGSQLRIAEDGSVQIGVTGGTYEKAAHSEKVNQRISDLETYLTTFINTLYNLHIHVQR